MSERAPDKQSDEENRHLASAVGNGPALGVAVAAALGSARSD
ncbi:MAG TPA: hypothetical protein VGC03_04620 [Acidimicrobiia bacterium]